MAFATASHVPDLAAGRSRTAFVGRALRSAALSPQSRVAVARKAQRPAHVPRALAIPPAETSMANALALQAAMFVCGPVLNIFTIVMIIRIVLTWYPKTDLKKVPWIFLAVPTEPLLAATREVIKPVGGVDISPIVWVAISTFSHEILMGPQGLLVLMSSK